LHSLLPPYLLLFVGSVPVPGVFGLLPSWPVRPRSAFRGAIVFAESIVLPDAAEFAAVLPVPPPVVVAVIPLSDLIYATRETNCSSVTCPLNVGMIG
jgi:hypothetical protein